jgi:hypothetical protein
VNIPTYATGDLYLSAYLVAMGHPVIETFGNGKKSFVFPGEVKPDVQAYRSGAAVPAVTYADAIRYMKRLVHSDGQGANLVNPRHTPPPQALHD